MFVDLMSDIYSTFTERFLKVQLVFEPPAPLPPQPSMRGGAAANGSTPGGQGTRKRYNALGILEEVPAVEQAGPDGNGDGDGAGKGTDAVLDIAADQPPKKDAVIRRDPVVVGAGRARSLGQPAVPASADWSNVGRNDPCPCGSGKKFKKCHGASL